MTIIVFTSFGLNNVAIFKSTGILLLCTIIYIIPRTAVVGAVMLTGYLGGAVATMARIGEPFYFLISFEILIWVS